MKRAITISIFTTIIFMAFIVVFVASKGLEKNIAVVVPHQFQNGNIGYLVKTRVCLNNIMPHWIELEFDAGMSPFMKKRWFISAARAYRVEGGVTDKSENFVMYVEKSPINYKDDPSVPLALYDKDMPRFAEYEIVLYMHPRNPSKKPIKKIDYCGLHNAGIKNLSVVSTSWFRNKQYELFGKVFL